MTRSLEEVYAIIIERSITQGWEYNKCPNCEHLKSRMSKQCMFCKAKGRPPMEQPDDPSYRFIPLTQGKFAIVDTADYEWLMQWKWCVMWIEDMHCFYSVRATKVNGKNRLILMHREILGLKRGDSRQGDHALHNTLDNRRFVNGKDNLRIATCKQNTHNTRKRKDNASGFKGVDFHKQKGKYRATITEDGKQIHLGYRDTPEEAHKLYCDAAKKRSNFSCDG